MYGKKAALLLDTDIFVNFLRGQQEEALFFHRVFVRDEFDAFYSSITEVELYAAERIDDHQIEKIKSLLTALYRVEVNPAVAALAARLLAKFRKSNGLGMPDAIIAASSLTQGLVLVTRNARHYNYIPGLVISLPTSYTE
jgi:predicted nucleic acid-binding protein